MADKDLRRLLVSAEWNGDELHWLSVSRDWKNNVEPLELAEVIQEELSPAAPTPTGQPQESFDWPFGSLPVAQVNLIQTLQEKFSMELDHLARELSEFQHSPEVRSATSRGASATFIDGRLSTMGLP